MPEIFAFDMSNEMTYIGELEDENSNVGSCLNKTIMVSTKHLVSNIKKSYEDQAKEKYQRLKKSDQRFYPTIENIIWKHLIFSS